tara:strand:+ start:362 stop:685 length:324 start_codon:yes stop_codon:yes gene_type:complete
MFTVTTDPQFTHVVSVQVPVDGGHKEETFKCRFRVIPVEELDDLLSVEGQKLALQRVIVSMSELVDEDKKDVPYSDELRDQLIAVPYVRAGLLRTYREAVVKARPGN